MKKKFNRKEIFDEVDKSNRRFDGYTKEQRNKFKKLTLEQKIDTAMANTKVVCNYIGKHLNPSKDNIVLTHTISRWTTVSPKEEGWYWYKSNKTEAMIVRIRELADGKFWADGDDGFVDFEYEPDEFIKGAKWSNQKIGKPI